MWGYLRASTCRVWGLRAVYGLEDGQGDILLPRAVLAHPNPKAGAEEKLPCRHQVALLGGFELQHRRVPDEGMELAGHQERCDTGEGGQPTLSAATAGAARGLPRGP